MDAVVVRSAQDDDYEAFARLFPELGIDDPTPGRDVWRRELLPATLIAERAGQTVGYLRYELLDGTAYVRNIVVAPETRRTGVGQALMRAAAARLRADGAADWQLNVKADNDSARRLYERLGMENDYASAALRLAWSIAGALPASEPGVQASPIEPTHDRAVELALALSPGQLAAARERGGRHLWQLREADTVVGAAVFDPHFPGAFPFRVARPSLAGPLVRALRPFALPHHDALGLVIEGDEPLEQSLIDAGASVRLRLLHYRGLLPTPLANRKRPLGEGAE